jgi:hypothetical protein
MSKLYYYITALFCLASFCPKAQDFARLFQAEDFTAENLFTNNIEGPAFDKTGNLFVVNFQKDGSDHGRDYAGKSDRKYIYYTF